VVELRYTEISDIVRSALKSGSAPEKLLEELKAGLDIVGEKYHNREYFLSELYMASETMKAALEILTPLLSRADAVESEGTVVIGSISGDIHDFGKAIASSLLTASGFKVYDLGVDVSPARFVDEAVRLEADVIGVSALLSSTQPMVVEVVDELKARGLRKVFKVIMGGTGVTSRIGEGYGVDAAVNDASEGVRVIRGWMAEKRASERIRKEGCCNRA
jgi:5-methyltetrahydrofolate--homocysteine methyltransferase